MFAQAFEDATFSAIVSWVNHKLEERRHFFPKLFSLIKLKFLSKIVLNTTVKTEVSPLHFIRWLMS